MKTEYKALLYAGSTQTKSYKQNLFMVNGALVTGERLTYLPAPTNGKTLQDIRDAAEKFVSVQDANGTVKFIEVTSYSEFKRVWREIVGREFK